MDMACSVRRPPLFKSQCTDRSLWHPQPVIDGIVQNTPPHAPHPAHAHICPFRPHILRIDPHRLRVRRPTLSRPFFSQPFRGWCKAGRPHSTRGAWQSPSGDREASQEMDRRKVTPFVQSITMLGSLARAVMIPEWSRFSRYSYGMRYEQVGWYKYTSCVASMTAPIL